MQRVVPAVHIATRILAILSALALLFTLWAEDFDTSFTCFETCPSPEQYYPDKLLGALLALAPSSVFAALALVAFLVYCCATRQFRRALTVFLFFVIVGVVGVIALNALLHYGQTTVAVDPESGLLVEDSVMEWANQWALTVLLFAVVWVGGLASLEWGRRWRRLSQPAPSQSATV
ncbi:MAG TPA: hypothetical protein VHR15_09590 [Ktedonobacterales bacterium]|jgi:hypothetical protein|nr:hypothetical protein [Ktedonobacterales bacterium]